MRVNKLLWTFLSIPFINGAKEEATVGDDENGRIEPESHSNSKLEEINLPELLTMQDFDKSTGSQLSFVEFYSPYCSHCKQLAPTWEQAYKEFYGEMQKMNIQMRQVNCIESGDLCEREEVFGYPALRIYAPVHDTESGEKTGRLKLVTDYPRSLVRTVDNFKKFIKNAVAEYDSGSIDLPSASKKCDLQTMLKLLDGDTEQPEFVMLYPGTAKQWEESEQSGKSAFNKGCYDCMDNKRIWDKLSNMVLTTIGANHFSCVDNPEMCERLGYKKMSTPSNNPEPKFLMFLPKKTGIIKFEYKGLLTIDRLKTWASKLYENSQYETVSAKTLSEIMDFRKSLPKEPLNLYYPLPNKVSIVFYYDPNKITDEDRAILPYLLDYVTYSPLNIKLFTAKSNKYESAINSQASNILDYIYYDDTEPKKQFNKAMYLATTLTTKPTIFIIKDNTLFTSIFQSYAPEDIRSSEKVIEFIEQNQFPLYQELTDELKPLYFPSSKKIDPKENDKIVVTFIDSNDAKKTDETFYKLSVAAHEYHLIKDEYYFNDILNKRELKQQRVDELKKQNANSVSIIKEMRKEVPHLFNNNDVLFTFIDIATNPKLANEYGWNIDGKDYKHGDTIIVSKDNIHYYDQDTTGKQLTDDPPTLKIVLQYLLDPKLIQTEGKISISKKLVGSPYFATLRFMDNIHERGFFGYVFLIIFIIMVIRFIHWTKNRKNNSNGSGGIITGVMGKTD